jgi:HK97 family phage portal protein
MNPAAAFKRNLVSGGSNRRVGPDQDPDSTMTIFGTGSSKAKEVISKSEAFDYNLGYVYACANKNAMVVSASRVRLFAMTAEGQSKPKQHSKRLTRFQKSRLLKAADARVVGGVELDEIYDHPFLDLMRSPAPGQTQQSLLANTQTGQELQGDSLWVVQYDRFLGNPKSVDVVPIHRVQIRLNKNGSIKDYVVRVDNRQIVVPKKNALHFKMPPSYDYFGTSPLSASSLSTKLFNNTLILESALAENQGIPSVVVKFKGGSLQREKMRQLESDWNSVLRGINKSGKVKVVDEEFDVDVLSLSPRELQFLQGRKMLREDICNIFGVPVTLFTSEANLASAKTAVDAYNLFTIEPRLQTLSQTLNSVINQWYPAANGRLFVALENQLDLKDEPRRQANVMQAHAQEIIDRDEARHLLNLGE